MLPENEVHFPAAMVKAHYSGLGAWLLQRATAVYLLGFIVYFGLRCLLAPPASYSAWQDWMRATGPRVASLLFFLALALHAWVGLRDIVIDYVKPLGLRLLALAAVAAGLSAVLAWAALVLAG